MTSANSLSWGLRVKPFIKWAGGKRWIVPALLPGLRRIKGRYIEPFLGGGAVAFAVAQPGMIIGDACIRLMEMYQQVARNPEGVHELLVQMPTDRDSYYRIRDEWYDDPIKRAAQFMYWNRAGYNGMHRVNSSGKFNIPYGDGKILFPTLDALKEASEILSKATLVGGDFGVCLGKAEAGDVVFADPPYAQTFSSYTGGGFGPADHGQLAERLHELADLGVGIVATNADLPEIRDLYAWANITEVDERHAVRPGSSRAACLVITANEELIDGW